MISKLIRANLDSIVLFLCLVFISQPLVADLPLEIRVSKDGRQLITGGLNSSGFYDQTVIRKINLQFDNNNYWNNLVSAYNAGTEVPATMSVDGVEYGRVGVKFRGETSYFMNYSQKKSFNISVDYEDSTNNVMGYKTLNLNCGFLDQSYMREVFFYEICRKHIPNAKANYIWLSINGADWGLYQSIQQLNGEYLKEWFQSSQGTRWRAEGIRKSPFGAVQSEPKEINKEKPLIDNGFGEGTSTLNYLGKDTSAYLTHYTLQKAHKENPWDDLVRTCDVLNNTPLENLEAELNKVMDVDRALWFLAHEIIFADDDGYVNKGGTDYYLYWERETGRLTPLEYDGNTCMSNEFVTAWTLFHKENNVKYPLMNRLFKVPTLRQRYIAHARTIIEESMSQAYIDSIVNAYRNFIDSYVKSEPKRIYTYNQFNSQKQVLLNFLNNRRNFLLSNNEVKAISPVIGKVEFYSQGGIFQNPKPGEQVRISAEASGTEGISVVYLYYSDQLSGVFSKIQMYDDGTNGDEVKDDGIFSANLPGFQTGTIVRFYIEAVSGNKAKTVVYSPQGAEHNVYFFKVEPVVAQSEDVVINEIMASNSTTAKDQDGEYDDWIEFYNKSGKTVELSGYFLSDKVNNLAKWVFPEGTTILPNGYLIVWADENGKQKGLHANFKLSASGERIFLSKPDTTVIQDIEFGQQQTDMGYARIPNGTGEFIIKSPTFAANNESDMSIKETNPNDSFIKIYPNPTRDGFVNIETNLQKIAPLYIVNTLGIEVLSIEFSGRGSIDLQSLSNGLYYVIYENIREKITIVK